MSAPDVRLISRGIIANGNFSVVHKELSPEGRIVLVLRDERQQSIAIGILPEILEDVDEAPPVPPNTLVDAVTRVVGRLTL
jgi:hypothetical protein